MNILRKCNEFFDNEQYSNFIKMHLQEFYSIAKTMQDSICDKMLSDYESNFSTLDLSNVSNISELEKRLVEVRPNSHCVKYYPNAEKGICDKVDKFLFTLIVALHNDLLSR